MKKISKNLIVIMIVIAILFSLSTLYTKSEANEYKDTTTCSSKTMFLNTYKGKYKGKDIVDVVYDGEAYIEYNYFYKKKIKDIKIDKQTLSAVYTGKSNAEKAMANIRTAANYEGCKITNEKIKLISTPAKNKWKIEYTKEKTIQTEKEESKTTGWTKVNNFQSLMGTSGLNNIQLVRTETRKVYNITVITKEETEYQDVTWHSTKKDYMADCKGRYKGANIVDVVYNGEAYKEYNYKYEKKIKYIDPKWSAFHYYNTKNDAENNVNKMKEKCEEPNKKVIYNIEYISADMGWGLFYKMEYTSTETKETGWTKVSNFQSLMGTAGLENVTLLDTKIRQMYNITVKTDGEVTDSQANNNQNTDTQVSPGSSNPTQYESEQNQTGTTKPNKVEEPGTDDKKTETIDKGTLSENAIEFTKKMYMAILGKTKEKTDKDITKESLIVKDIVEGKIDAAGLIGYFENLEKPYANLSLEEYAKYMNKAILEKDITDEEISKIKEKYKESQNYQSEILEDIINSEEFKSLCEKYTIEVGTYVPTKFNKDTTEEKATEFVKNLYTTVINKEPSNEEINNIVKYITDGKITASSVLKAFFESDEFKNLKVTDDKYVEILAKACQNKELTENQKKEYTEKLINGTTRNELLKEFMNSDFANICNNYGLTKGNYEPSKLKTTEELATEFIKNVHSAVLGEESQVGQSLKNSLITGNYSSADLIQIYVESTNFAKRVEVEDMTNSDYVKTLIKACLQREAKSEDEIKQYEDKIDELYKSSVLEEFFKTEEYKKLCNRYYLVAGQYVDNKQNNESDPTVENYGTGGAKITTKQRTLSNGKNVKSIIKVQFDTSKGIVGDVDGDGNIDTSDASLILSYVAIQELYFEKPTEEVLKVADIDGDKMITIEDAQYVLQYYAMHGAKLNPTWEEAIKAAKDYGENGETLEKDENIESNKQNENSNFLSNAKKIKQKVADEKYTYGHGDPTKTKEINCTSYVSLALNESGFNYKDKDGNLINYIPALVNEFNKGDDFKKIYEGKTLNIEETGAKLGDVIFMGSDEENLTHVQIYAGKNEQGEKIFYSCGNNNAIARQPGEDTKSDPYAPSHYIVSIYRLNNDEV